MLEKRVIGESTASRKRGTGRAAQKALKFRAIFAGGS
jgi:hypothetical protein